MTMALVSVIWGWKSVNLWNQRLAAQSVSLGHLVTVVWTGAPAKYWGVCQFKYSFDGISFIWPEQWKVIFRLLESSSPQRVTFGLTVKVYAWDHYAKQIKLLNFSLCHNDHGSVSYHQPHGCLLNRLFGRRTKKTSKLRVTAHCAGNSPGPVNSPHKGPVTRKMFPFDDVIMSLYFAMDAIYRWWVTSSGPFY